MHHLCLPMGLNAQEMERLDNIIGKRRKVARNTALYRMGEDFKNLYAVRLGHFKTFQTNRGGAEQITGFQMPGELLGLDAISTDLYQCHAVALEDSEVCEIPFALLQNLFLEIPRLQRHFHRMMSQEITREQSVMLLLGNMSAEQKLASFFLNLSARYIARGYSDTNLHLRMTREDIGNYLGLTIESVSRLLTRFKQQRLIDIKQREVDLLNLDRLKALITTPL
jgi:CRP/FNR family transcriptional regulator